MLIYIYIYFKLKGGIAPYSQCMPSSLTATKKENPFSEIAVFT